MKRWFVYLIINLYMSEMSHCHSLLRHHSHHPPLTPDLTHLGSDHRHLGSDHRHLSISNQDTLKSMLHSVIHCPVYRSLPCEYLSHWLSRDTPAILPRCSPLILDSSAPAILQGYRLSVFCKTFPGLNSVSFSHLPLLSTSAVVQ